MIGARSAARCSTGTKRASRSDVTSTGRTAMAMANNVIGAVTKIRNM